MDVLSPGAAGTSVNVPEFGPSEEPSLEPPVWSGSRVRASASMDEECVFVVSLSHASSFSGTRLC